jgi:hypothetical protein
MATNHGTFSKLWAAALAAMVALVVWFFAEGESVSSRTVVVSVSFPLEPVGDLLVRPDAGFKGVVRVTLEGTTRTIDLAAAAVGGEIQLKPGSPGVPDAPGQQSVDLREALGSLPKLKGLGSTLAQVEPKAVVVNVVKLATKEVPVTVELGAEIPLDVEPTCSPAVVTVRVPADKVGALSNQTPAVAVVGGAELRRILARGNAVFANGGMQIVQGLVRAPDASMGIEPILISPEQVTVTLRLKRTVATLKMPTVPVWVCLPSTEDSGKWIVEVQDKVVTDVTLTGPAEELERIRSGEIAVRAVVELSGEDLAKAATSKAATFPGLPPGVSATANQVRIARIVKREPEKVPAQP